MSTSWPGTNKTILFKCSLCLAGLLVLAELLAVATCMHNDADNQLVALGEEENDDLNDLNQGTLVGLWARSEARICSCD